MVGSEKYFRDKYYRKEEKYSPKKVTRSGRTIKKVQRMQGTLGNEGPKRLTTEDRMKLLKATLKKSSRLTENLLRRLGRGWEDVFKEESDDEARKASITYSL